MGAHKLKTSFTAGQLSEKLLGRSEAGVYENGAKEITNGLLMSQGGVTRRPGTVRRAVLPERARIETRVYSRDAAFVFAFTHTRLDIYLLDGTLAQSFTGQPWTDTTMWFLTFDHFGALSFICDQSFRPRVLRRTGTSSFAIAEMAFDTDVTGAALVPLHKYEDEAVTLTASGWSGSVILTASAGFFVPDHAGLTFSIRSARAIITSYISSTQVVATLLSDLLQPLDPAPFSAVLGSPVVTVTLVDHGLKAGDFFTIANAAKVGRTLDNTGGLDLNGGHTVTRVLDADRFTLTAGANADGTEDAGGSSATIALAAATRRWKEPVFSAVRGWPQCVVIDGSRLCLGGSPQLGDAVFMSRVGSFFDFSAGEGGANDAVTAIAQTQGNELRHLVSSTDLLAFGDEGEASFPKAPDTGITQDTVRGVPATKLGAAYARPVAYDGAVLFVDVMGQHVHEFAYVEGLTAYVSTPVSALCPELIREPVHGGAFKGGKGLASPYASWSMIDGTAAVFSSRRAEGAAGWASFQTNGGFVSMAGANERWFVCARRVVNGLDQFWLEEFDFAGAWRADASVLVARDTPGTVWPSTAHGAARVLDVVNDETGEYIGRVTTDVTGGFVTPTPALRVRVGLPFTFRVETLPPNLSLPSGATLGETQRIVKVVTQLLKTTYVKIDGVVRVNRLASDVLAALGTFTGFVKTGQLGHRRGPTVVIESDLPEPCTVLGVLTEVV